MKKFEKTAEKWIEYSNQLRKDCEEYLNQVLDKRESVCWAEDEIDEWICVTYDGGRHPEYDSNAYSTVYGVWRKEGKIVLDIEDTSEYSIERVETDELYSLCQFLEDVILPTLAD